MPSRPRFWLAAEKIGGGHEKNKKKKGKPLGPPCPPHGFN
jgi:hypothetical protein